MQSKKLEEKLFTQSDWETAAPLDRLYIHLMQPEEFPLSVAEEIRLEALRETFAVMCSKMSTWRRIKVLRKVFEVSERTIHRYMEDAKYLFGDILKTDAQIELVILKDKYYALAERAELAGDYNTARRCYDSAQAIIKRIQENLPKDKRVFAAVIFTDNPKALTKRSDDAEDIEFEEGGILELEAVTVPAGQAAD